jgi:hypothetical protein
MARHHNFCILSLCCILFECESPRSEQKILGKDYDQKKKWPGGHTVCYRDASGTAMVCYIQSRLTEARTTRKNRDIQLLGWFNQISDFTCKRR